MIARSVALYSYHMHLYRMHTRIEHIEDRANQSNSAPPLYSHTSLSLSLHLIYIYQSKEWERERESERVVDIFSYDNVLVSISPTDTSLWVNARISLALPACRCQLTSWWLSFYISVCFLFFGGTRRVVVSIDSCPKRFLVNLLTRVV